MNDFPDTVRTLRIAAWMWIVYLLTLVCMDLFIYAGALSPRSLLRGQWAGGAGLPGAGLLGKFGKDAGKDIHAIDDRTHRRCAHVL